MLFFVSTFTLWIFLNCIHYCIALFVLKNIIANNFKFDEKNIFFSNSFYCSFSNIIQIFVALFLLMNLIINLITILSIDFYYVLLNLCFNHFLNTMHYFITLFRLIFIFKMFEFVFVKMYFANSNNIVNRKKNWSKIQTNCTKSKMLIMLLCSNQKRIE